MKSIFGAAVRMLWRIGRLLILALLGLSVLLALFQERLLHHPEKIELAVALRTAGELGLKPWPNADQPRGWQLDPVGKARGSLVLFHGNAGHALQRHWLAKQLAAYGYRTFLMEYPDYGHRQGRLDETSIVADAAQSLKELRRAYPDNLIVAGESLGAGVAAAALAQSGYAAEGLWLITPWNTLADTAAHHYPWVPVRWLLRDRYDTAAHLKAFKGKTALIVAGQDRVIPSRLGMALHAQLPGKPMLLHLPAADHNDWAESMTPQHWQALTDFFGDCGRCRT